MGEWTVDGCDGIKVAHIEQMMGIFLARVYDKAKDLQSLLDSDPLQFERVEQMAKELFDHGAGLFLTGLIAKTMKSPEHEQRSDNVRDGYCVPLRTGQDRQIQVHLGSGFACHAKTRYCQPKSNITTDPIPGLDSELSLFGFSGGVSPWLISKVTRTVALSGSLSQAHAELLRDGIKLPASVIDRIVTKAGMEQLTQRQRMLQEFESGQMEPGNEFAGQTVSIQVDGGRTRTRSELNRIDPLLNFGKTQSEVSGQPSQGRSKEERRQASYTAAWREPKLFTIYVHDKQGRKNKLFSELVDGSFANAAYAERLIAMHMFRLGLQKAKSITFNSDGATWIWERIDSILKRAHIPESVLVFRVLDVYHAAENIGKGVKALGRQTGDAIEFRPLRTMLRDGAWSEIASTLETSIDAKDGRCANNEGLDRNEVLRVVRYLRNHGAAGHLDYPKFSLMGLPLGSGSIESAIRRVINLRMKGNGTFWRLPKAECILVLRSSIISGRWDEDRKRVKLAMQKNRKLAMPPIQESEFENSDAKLEPLEIQ